MASSVLKKATPETQRSALAPPVTIYFYELDWVGPQSQVSPCSHPKLTLISGLAKTCDHKRENESSWSRWDPEKGQKKKKKVEGGKKHTKYFKENNLKINELSEREDITRGSIREVFLSTCQLIKEHLLQARCAKGTAGNVEVDTKM